MNVKPLVFLFLFVFSFFRLPAQVSPSTLQWSDFKGKPDLESKFDALIYWGVNYSYSASAQELKGNTVVMDIKATYFLKEDSSWVKANRASDRLLNHEKGHFKIAELLVLDFLYEANRGVYLKRNHQAKIEALFDKTYKKYVDLQIQYDEETNHMKNAQAQKEWDVFLKKKKQYFIERQEEAK